VGSLNSGSPNGCERMVEFFAFSAWLVAIVAVVVAFRALVEIRVLRKKILTLESQGLASRSGVERGLVDDLGDALRGVRVQCSVENEGDGFEELLRGQFLRFGGELVLESGDVVGAGSMVSHGYPDVYFRADFEFRVGEEVVLSVRERRDEGDRQSNLAMEIASGLARAMVVRRERDALRELGETSRF
jgi:hypothetical protein